MPAPAHPPSLSPLMPIITPSIVFTDGGYREAMEYVAKMMQVVTRARANTCHLKTGVGQQDWTECEDRTAKGLQRLLRQRVRELRAARQRSELYEQKQQQKPSLSLPIIHGDAYHGHLDNSHRSIPDCLQQDSISSIKEKATADSITSKDRVFELDVYRRCDQALLERWTIQYTPSVTHHHSNKQNTSSETDETEFILLAQSLFSQVRLLPVQSALHDAILAKNDLGCAIRLLGMEEALTDDDDDYEELNNTLHPRWVVSNSELTVYPFRPAVALRGALKVSLLYDPSVGGLRDVNRHKTLPKGASRHDYNRLSNSPSLPTPPSASTPSISVNQQHTSWSNSQPREIRPSVTKMRANSPPRPGTPPPNADIAVQLERLARLKLARVQRPQLARSRLSFTQSATDETPVEYNTSGNEISTKSNTVKVTAEKDNSTSLVEKTPLSNNLLPSIVSSSAPLTRSLSGLTRMLRDRDNNSQGILSTGPSLPPLLPSLPDENTVINNHTKTNNDGDNNCRHHTINTDDDDGNNHSVYKKTIDCLGEPKPYFNDLNQPSSRYISSPSHTITGRSSQELTSGKLMPHSFRSVMQIRPPVVTPTSPTLPSPLRNSFDALGNNGLSLSLSHSLRPYPSRSMNRRASITGELFGSFIGSYEESILSGRMSTLPSRPIEFIAQIGVLGRGNCRSSLKCPPHINLPFPATFYNMQDDDAPTPYVGNIDLEHASADVLKQKKSTATRHGVVGYRIPTAGQLQVVIKNPNKTAIKLFLVPYDFSDMPIGTKTFIRQKSYAQPASDATTTTTTNSQSNNGNNRPVLRYAIQLQVCSPSRGRIYLYKHIRVVFSHRVPDGSEKLQVVCDGPGEPRYSPLTAACLSSNTGNSSINNGQNGSFRNTTKHLTNLLNVTTTTKGMQGRARAVSDVAHTVVVSRNEFKAQLDLCEQKKPPLMECTNTDRSTTMLTSSTTSALTLPLPFPSSSSSSSLRTSTSHKSVANHSHVPLSSQPPSPHPSIPILCFPSNHSEKPPHLPS